MTFHYFFMFTAGAAIAIETYVLLCQLGYAAFYPNFPRIFMHAAEWARLEASHSYRHSRERLSDTSAVCRRLLWWLMVIGVVAQAAPHWALRCTIAAVVLLELNFIVASWPLCKFQEGEFFFTPIKE